MAKAIFVVSLLGAIAFAVAQCGENKKCGKGEVYSKCGSSCPPTCESRGNTCQACTAACVKGCFCKPNTVRAPDGSCVPPEKCPPHKCGPNEVFVKCPPNCPEKCDNLWSKKPCKPSIDCCHPQCRCKPGYYRDAQNKCISARECKAHKND